MDYDPIQKEFVLFVKAFVKYVNFRLRHWGLKFENFKNFVVDILMVRRGANTSVFVHFSILGLAFVVFVAGGVILPSSVVSGSFPGVAANPLVAGASVDLSNQGVISSSITPVTVVSDKPRDKVIDYTVKSGDTITSVANNFGVSNETIIWENNLSKNGTLKEGQNLRILPVSGVAHKVESGDTIYSVAKKYQANAQAIIDFPFNDVGDNFALTSGQNLIIPDGAPATETSKPAPTQYLAATQIADTNISKLGNGQLVWPANGGISQFFSWYHPGIDVANLAGGQIRASDSGTVIISGWPDNSGYGNRVLLDHGNGYKTLYAHMSAVYVSAGQKVGKGEVLGAMGSTGRSTGTHLHFEVIREGKHINPYAVLGGK